MSKDECTKERFLGDVKKHEMEIVRDDGIYRHIIFKRPESSNYRFDIHTWPWYLCITGDMGCWVFSRIEDMFYFFIRDGMSFEEDRSVINTGYWEEKIQSVSKFGGPAREFSPELFKERVIEYAEEYFEFDEEKKKECLEELEWSVLSYIEDSHPQVLYEKLWNFSFGDFRFDEPPCAEEYTFHYVWICYAIVWGILKYNEYKEGQNNK